MQVKLIRNIHEPPQVLQSDRHLNHRHIYICFIPFATKNLGSSDIFLNSVGLLELISWWGELEDMQLQATLEGEISLVAKDDLTQEEEEEKEDQT
jgi:hypothetical protein